MNEKKIQMRLKQLEEADPKILIKILELLLRSSSGRFMDFFIFRDIVPSDVPIDKKKERRINTLSVVGAAILQAQKDLLEENEILNLEQEEMLKIVGSGGEVNRVALETNHKLGVLQKEEMDFLEKFLRLEIDFSCGTGTIGLNERDIEIRGGFQITVPIDPKEKVVPFPSRP